MDNLDSSVEEFRAFLSIPNSGTDSLQLIQNLNWCINALESRGIKTKILMEGGVPHLYGSGKFDPSKKTILVYMQIDGQPVDSAKWHQESPFIPVLKKTTSSGWEKIPWQDFKQEYDPEWRIFARSSSDSKGPAMIFMSALDILKKNGKEPSVNLKFLLDFQEELSSPSLATVVEANSELFKADGIFIMDGTRHMSNLPNLAFGARGIATARLRVFGPKNNLHSGQYGNFAPNPVFSMSRLLASMKDEQGVVLIPGFYDGVKFSKADLETMASVPEDMDQFLDDLGIAEAEKVGKTYQEAIQFPSLNVRGLNSGWTGDEVRTIIPAEVVVEFDIRLVKETPAERQLELLKNHIEKQGYHLIDREPTDEERKRYSKLAQFSAKVGSLPFRSEMDSEFALWLEKGMRYIFGDNYVKTRITGGSQPMAPFINVLGIPAVSVRIPNPDNNIHGPNENIRMGNYLEGIETCVSILTQVY